MKTSAGKRVLMLVENNSYPRDVRVRRESEGLVAAGYRVTVISPARRSQPFHERCNGVSVYRYPAPAEGQGQLGYVKEYGYAMVATFCLSLLVLLREGFDVIHAANPPDTFVVIAAFYKLLGKRFVFDHHDLVPETYYYARFGGQANRCIYRILLLFEKLSCRLADHVIATNHSYKAMDMRRGSVSEERITVVRNGPELDRMWPVEPDQDLRQKAGTIIAYAGEMGVQDGGDHAVRALWHLVYDLGRTDVFCVMIGTGDARASWQALARQLDLDAYIWFTGWIPEADFIRYLSTADICVAPDPSNPFTDRSTMNKVMDYMALARPIVAFDLREHRVTAQEAALYVRPNDELAFAHALAQLMDDPDRRQAMGAYGRRRVEEALAWHHSLPHLLKAYSSLLSGPDGAQDCRRGACESTEIWPKDNKH